MAQRYKLRLSDGTVLLVDYDGLSTWLVDGEAKVQPVGSSQWRPLKKFLAQERRAARRAERERASSREALPLVYPEPKEKDEPAPVLDPAPPSPEPVDTSAIGAPEGIQAFADDPGLPATASAPGPSTPDEIAPAGLPDVVVEDEPEPPHPGEPAGVTALADEPVAPAAASVPVPPTPDEAAPVSLPLPPVEDEAPRVTVGTPRVVSEPSLLEPTGGRALSEDPVAPAAAFVPVPPTPDDVAPVSLPRSTVEDESPSIGEPAGVQSLAEEPVVQDPGTAAPPAPPGNGFVSPNDFWPAPDERTGTRLAADDGPPVIPLKPLDDDRVERPWRAARAFRTEDEGEDLAERILRPGSLGEKLFHGLARLGGFLSRVIEPINRLERGLPLLPPGRPVPRRPEASPRKASMEHPPPAAQPGEVGVLAEEVSGPVADAGFPRSAADDGLPVIPLKPIDDGPAPPRIVPRLRRLQARASAGIESLVARVGRLARREGPTPSGRRSDPTPSRVAEPTPRVPLAAPPPVTDLPTLHFAATHEPAAVEDIYEGNEDLPGVNVVRVAWLWTRRLVLIAVLAAGAVFAVQNWESWFPKAGELGNTVFVEVDKRVRSLDVSERQQQAVEVAVEELPHLAPETIRLVMSSSPAGVLDPSEVFGVACDAADRGGGTLTTGEVEELSALRRELLDTLRPSERQRIREYDRARAREMVFPYEHRLVLALYARGARALPAESRERLQTLSGKAIAAGLAVPVDLDPLAAAEH
jgi:hypothetical protein